MPTFQCRRRFGHHERTNERTNGRTNVETTIPLVSPSRIKATMWRYGSTWYGDSATSGLVSASMRTPSPWPINRQCIIIGRAYVPVRTGTIYRYVVDPDPLFYILTVKITVTWISKSSSLYSSMNEIKCTTFEALLFSRLSRFSVVMSLCKRVSLVIIILCKRLANKRIRPLERVLPHETGKEYQSAGSSGCLLTIPAGPPVYGSVVRRCCREAMLRLRWEWTYAYVFI
jgi:hypothetical protein